MLVKFSAMDMCGLTFKHATGNDLNYSVYVNVTH